MPPTRCRSRGRVTTRSSHWPSMALAIVQPLLVTPKLSLAGKPRTLLVGELVEFQGQVRPVVPGHPVLVQRKVGHHWLTVATVSESSLGYYKTAVSMTKAGTYSFR